MATPIAVPAMAKGDGPCRCGWARQAIDGHEFRVAPEIEDRPVSPLKLDRDSSASSPRSAPFQALPPEVVLQASLQTGLPEREMALLLSGCDG